MVRQAAGKPLWNETARPRRRYEEIPLFDVAPNPGELAKLAHDFRWRRTLHPVRLYRRLEYAGVRRLIAGLGRGVGNDELLSYLLFDREFAKQQIKLGREHARAALEAKHMSPKQPERGLFAYASWTATSRYLKTFG
jgi:hypothetical protein